MTKWLHAVAGDVDMLLRVERIRGIAAAAEAQLPLVDLAIVVGGATPYAARERAVITYDGAPAAGALGMAVDLVRGIVSLPPHAVVGLPPFSPAFAALFDAIAAQALASGRYPLCVRADLDPAGLLRLAAGRSRGRPHAS